MKVAKITSKGMVNLPVEVRNKLGVDIGDHIVFIEKGGVVTYIYSSNNS